MDTQVQDAIDDMIDEMSGGNSETEGGLNAMCKIMEDIVKEENQIEVGRFIMNTNNSLLNQLKDVLNTNDEDILRIIDNAYLQEKTDDEIEE